jgi:undecaprenyl-diphosphatase
VLATTALLGSVGTASAACTGDGASGGILRLDRCDEFEATGLYSRNNQKRVDLVVIAGTIGVALWSGSESPTGRTAWKAFDSIVTTAVATEVMKNLFQRPRPAQSDDPDLWRQGSGHKSFPSGETAMVAAFVTPYLLELHGEYPAAWGLLALPLYMGAARMTSQGHWLTDVLVGAGVGAVMGVQAHQRERPLVLTLTGNGVFVGWKTKF